MTIQGRQMVEQRGNASGSSWTSREASRLYHEGLVGKGSWKLCAATDGTAGLTFPYDSVHNQPGWVKLLGEVQGSLGRVLVCLEVHIRLQP